MCCVLILYNFIEPSKNVKEVLLNSINVQDAFKKSCFHSTILIYRRSLSRFGYKPYILFISVTGFIRVYSKDIYQLKLSNVLSSKSGASGVRTGLISLSAVSEKKKNEGLIHLVSAVIKSAPSLTSDCIAPCGRWYKENKSGYY